MIKSTLDPGTLEIPFRTLGTAFADYAAQHPEKTAIHAIDQARSISFIELQELTDRVAARMVMDGVKYGDRVAILASECLEKLVLMFAAWRCGASSCPFHAEIAPDHLTSILHTIEPALIVWRQNDLDGAALTEGISCPAYEFSSLDAATGYFGDLPKVAINLPIIGTEYGPEDEGCIFATSGTTDRPKCVVWDHLGLWLCGLSTIDFTGMHEEDRILEYRTFSWLSPQIVTFMPFVSLGLTIVMAEGFSRSRFLEWIKEHSITVAAGVPTVINMLLDEPVAFNQEDIETLRIMTASSAPLAPERWQQFESHYGIRLLQFYGASEGGWLCGNRLDKFRIGTAGPPARHMDLAILDPRGNECAAGVEGEITIKGPQTALASISANGIWEDRSGFRLTERTRVGDLGIMDAEGFVTVTGRVKDIILRGGVSIAPLEIDAALMSHPSVHEAAVIGVPDRVWGEEIAAYVVKTEGINTLPEEILAHAAKILPESKRPKTVEFVKSLPKNERGKIRRETLKKLRRTSDA
ncbi:MAG: Long-chain-fatty-acid--CoA ligase [Alphaproteobacteria bacterium MarineAlpha11_Bin1]|nr:MAG: Long-chain-fatty-acid--CoA ligase [Alphaproteobacteria bacterium MarineAlpha11_Bin1]|tara:strand:+ start:5766 stop:7337 length:1572 start_codon:yes stop_codon:yes gene_type:complete